MMSGSQLPKTLEEWLAPYGLPEKLWLGLWGILTPLFALSQSRMDGPKLLFSVIACFVAVLVVSQITFRLGRVVRAIGRTGLGFLVAFFGYESSGAFISAYRTVSYEPQMIAFDEWLFGGHVSVALQAIHHPALTEYLQAIYMFYFPQLIVVPIALMVVNKWKEFYLFTFTITSAIILTHTFYFIVPLQSPFLVADLYPEALAYTFPLQGLWYADSFRQTLLNATTIRHDCFPSGHTMHSLVALYFAWKVNKKFGIVLTFVASSIIFSTLYLRYHYLVDLLAGFAFAGVILVVCIRIGSKAWETEQVATNYFATAPEPEAPLTAIVGDRSISGD